MYVWGFRVRQHLRSLAPVMNDDDNDGQMIFEDLGGPKASRHLSYRWGKTPKKPHPGNLFRPGIEPGSTAWQACMLPPGPQRWTTTLVGTEHHHSSWQCKESHCCCHGPLVLLVMGDSGTSTALTWYESMWLWCLHQSERAIARDPVQHKRGTYLCYRAINMEHQQWWMHCWCKMPSKHLTKGDYIEDK